MPPSSGPIEPVHALGIPGSIRRHSFNRWLLEACREVGPDCVVLDITDLDGIPLYNADLDVDGVRPAAVEQLKREVRDADAVLIATPEYNHSVPGVLQNALDWISRPALQSPLRGKPAAVMGASPGVLGAVRAQQQLKLVLLSTLALVMPHVGVAVTDAAQKFDADGALRDAATRQVLRSFLEDFARWVLGERIVRDKGAELVCP